MENRDILVKKEVDKQKTEEKWEKKYLISADLYGQENVCRAAEIVVAGGHNLLMVGPPGSGKTMTAVMYGRNSAADEL